MTRNQTLATVAAIALMSLPPGSGAARGESDSPPEDSPASESAGVSTKTWAPLERRAAPFRVTAGKGEGRRLIQRVSPLDHDGNEPLWQMRLGDRRTTWLKQREDGELAVVKQVIPDEDAQVFYEPAATLLPGRIEAGESVEQAGRVTIYGLDDEKRAEGTFRQSIEYPGRVRVRTPAGTFTGHRIRLTQHLDTTLADVRVVMDMVFVEDVGRVYQHMTKNTVKLGLFESTNIEEIKRVEE